MEGEEAVGDLRVKGGDEGRNLGHFLAIDIARDEEGAGDKEGR